MAGYACVRPQIGVIGMNRHYTKLAKSNIDLALSRSQAAEELKHPGLRGRAREIFVKDLLSPFLNPTLGACTGIIVDSKGNSSRQIDIIVYDTTLIPSMMLTGEEGIVPYESVLATIEVKSKLTMAEFRKAVLNARSIKTLVPQFNEVMCQMPDKNSPLCCVFAYSSTSRTKNEQKRLHGIVDGFNKVEDTPVYVPLSGVCVGNFSFTKCVAINDNKPTFENVTVEPALNFLVYLIDEVTKIAQQRNRMFIKSYFFDT